MSQPKQTMPDWTKTPPPKGSYRSIFKWGGANKFKHPNQYLYAMVKERFNMGDADFKSKLFEGHEVVECQTPVRLQPEQITSLKAIVGEENIATHDYDRVKYASGKTMEEAMMLRRGITGEVADLVVHPRHKEDVKKIVAYCHDAKIPIYVYGGGSSVTLGLKCVKGGISLVMQTHMNGVLDFNEVNQTITVEPGMLGPAYEALLNQAPEKLNARRRYTGGHFPESFEYSSVGGWIVTLGSGQTSTYYGDMYDMVISQEYVTPRGTFKTQDYPATATGPKINDIMKGSEGAFGVLVAATLKIFRHMPQNRRKFAFVFPDWESTVKASREITQAEFGLPAVYRISDPEETKGAFRQFGVQDTFIDKLITFRGYRPNKRCLCYGYAEGEAVFARNVKRKIKKICKKEGAIYISSYPVTRWERDRFSNPYMREDLNDYGIIADTLECSVTWDNLHRVHQGVRAFIKRRTNTICFSHASHFYPQGTNLYFIFITRLNNVEQYKAFQKSIIDQIERHGGSLSHHHGVGKMSGFLMERHLGKEQMDILRALKEHFDPHNIMNPGGTLGFN